MIILGLWYSWLTHLPCTQESPVRIRVAPQNFKTKKMKVTLNRESWHYRLFKKEFPYTTPPSSLCPYFWITVGLCLMTPFLSAIRGLEKASKWISSLKTKKKEVVKPEQSHEEWLAEWNTKIKKDRIRQEKMHKVGKVLLYLLFISGLFFSIFGLYNVITNSKVVELLIGIGLVGVMFGFAFGLATIITKYGHYLSDGIIRFFSWINPFKWSITKMIGWMIVAGYKKMCPLVEWSGEEIKK